MHIGHYTMQLRSLDSIVRFFSQKFERKFNFIGDAHTHPPRVNVKTFYRVTLIKPSSY